MHQYICKKMYSLFNQFESEKFQSSKTNSSKSRITSFRAFLSLLQPQKLKICDLAIPVIDPLLSESQDQFIREALRKQSSFTFTFCKQLDKMSYSKRVNCETKYTLRLSHPLFLCELMDSLDVLYSIEKKVVKPYILQ